MKLDIWAYTDNENTQPLPFEARFIPRSESIRRLIVEEAEAARASLQKFESEREKKVEAFLS